MVRTTSVLVSRFRSESRIFNPQPGSLYDPLVMLGSIHSMKSYLLELVGSDDKDGQYYRNDANQWATSRIPALEWAIKQIDQKFSEHQKFQMNLGKTKPTKLPSELEQAMNELQAKLIVAKEERDHLIQAIDQVTREEIGKKKRPLPRKQWSQRKHVDNVLIEVAGWQVRPNDEGIMHIQDETSPFNGLAVHRFVSQVLRPMEHQKGLMQRREAKLAQNENRGIQTLPFPKAPIYDAKKGIISYPGYDPRVIQKAQKKGQSENTIYG